MIMSNPGKTGIVLVPYGTSSPQAVATYERILGAYRREFPGMPMRLAFTSELMIRRLEAKEGISILSPQDAFDQLYGERCDRAIVQSLQIVPGGEFHRLVSLCRDWERQEQNSQSKSLKFEIGLPLLSGLEDCRMVSRILPDIWGGHAREEESEGGQTGLSKSISDLDSGLEAMVLAGHGTGHPADSVYSLMARVLKKDFSGRVLLGTIEGFPGLEEMNEELEDLGARKVRLCPFLLVAGEHARNDIAGTGPGSWRSTLEREGFEVDVRLSPLGEMDGIVRIFQEHTRKAMERMASVEKPE